MEHAIGVVEQGYCVVTLMPSGKVLTMEVSAIFQVGSSETPQVQHPNHSSA